MDLACINKTSIIFIRRAYLAYIRLLIYEFFGDIYILCMMIYINNDQFQFRLIKATLDWYLTKLISAKNSCSEFPITNSHLNLNISFRDETLPK
jgi:hypothetical protein